MLYKEGISSLLFLKLSGDIRRLILLFCCISFMSACDKNEDVPPLVQQPVVKLSTSATLGAYLTDTLGNTLYYFSNDYDGQNNCAGGCAALWPVFYAGDNLTQDGLGTGLDIADFGMITVAGGQKQTTYKSWPLYYYAPAAGGTNVRESPGETEGEGFGNIWYVAKPDYSIMLVNAQLVGSDGKSYKSDLTEGTGKTLYFSDPLGVSLYSFSKDSANLNKFTKPDFSNNSVWPIYETDKMVVPSTLDKSLFGTTGVYGKTQLTYKGWPLYYFGADDLQRGLNQGISFPAVGIWPIMQKDAPAAPLP